MMFHNFHGDQSEPMLTKLVIAYPKGTFTSMTQANSKLYPLFLLNRPVHAAHFSSLRERMLKEENHLNYKALKDDLISL
jgi:hypothetical protein